CTRHRGYFDVW
nr:immunoglobulin heavy chain junction region [Mus musculus]